MFKKHFRTNKLIKHPAYIFAKKGDIFYCFYVTHQKKWKGIKNIPLHGKLNPNDTHEKQYIVPILAKAKIDKFYENTLPLKFSKKDGSILRMLYKKYNIRPLLNK